MAAEMRELGLTEEDLKSLAYNTGNESVLNSLSKTPKRTNNGVKHKKEKQRPLEKRGQKKKGHMVGYLKSPGSDSDSSSYESSDNFYSPPRGLEYKQTSHNIEGGRGKPFYPNAINHRTLYSQGGDTYNHVNRMVRDLDPLIQLTDSRLFRNDNIEEIWASNKSAIPKTISSSLPPENNNIECEMTVLPMVEPKQVVSPVNIGKPLDNITNSTPAQPYKNALINAHNNETISCSSDERSSICGKLDRLSMKVPSNNCDKIDSDNSIRKKREDRVKTQLYIPPHLRKRIADAETNDSASDCSVAINPPIKHQPPSTNENSPQTATPQPAKRSMAELTKKNVLISTLLKKQKQQQQQQLSSPSIQSPSSAVSSSSASTPGMSSGDSAPSRDNVISTSSSSLCRPSQNDYRSRTDPVYSPPSRSELSSCSPLLPSTEILPVELVEFYDIEDPPAARVDSSPYSPLEGRGEELLLRPPSEFGGNEYYYYDEDTKQFVHYRIPETPPSESSGGGSSQISHTAVNGSSSAFSSFNGSSGQHSTGGSSQTSRAAVIRPSSAFSSFNGSAMGQHSGFTPNRGDLYLQSKNKSPPGLVDGRRSNSRNSSAFNNDRSPPSNNLNQASYNTSGRSPSSDTRGPGMVLWPPPSSSDSEYYDQEYPSMS